MEEGLGGVSPQKLSFETIARLSQLNTALRLIREDEDEIRTAWKEHFRC
jgi:hypothetical protein